MSNKTEAKTNQTLNSGEKLEQEVQRIYILLGAKDTKRRMLIKTYEIDVCAKFSKGPIDFTVIVECKEYNEKKMVSDDDMKNFVVKLLAARECGKADKGVFVTTSGYTKNSLSTANLHNIQCLTLNELYNQLVDFEEYLTDTIVNFEKSDLSKWYNKQRVSDVEDYNSLTKSESEKVMHPSAIDYLDEIISKENARRIAVLGNFGTGKTSLCIKYKYDLVKAHLSNTKKRIPVLVNLRDFGAGIDIHQLITNYLQKLPGIEIDLKLCLELQRMGRFIFILDGLDEMATRVDRVVINENLREIDRLFSDNNNIYLLTCRTHFFQEKISDEFLKDYRVVFLVDWNHDDLKTYLQKRFGQSWNYYLDKITSRLTLEELAKTPMLLDMIVNSLSQINDDEEINLTILYKTYTDEWIDKQSKRRGAVMSSSQRRKLVESIAKKLYVDGVSSIHFSELYEIAKDMSGYVDATRIDYFDTDARTSTFVTKDSYGNYSFYHRSFMEFFCASIIVNEINLGKPYLLSNKDIPNEVFDLLDLKGINTKSGVNNLGGWSKLFKEKYLARNSAQLLLKLNQKVDKKVEEYFGFTKSQWDDLENALKNDEGKLIEKFYNQNSEKIRSMAHSLTSRYDFSADDTNDLIQELLLKLWLSMKDGKLKSNVYINLDNYIHAMLRDLMADKARLKYRTQVGDLEFLNENYLFNDSSQSDSAREYMWQTIDNVLNEKYVVNKDYIRAFYAVYKDGYDIKVIAKRLKVTSISLRVIFNRMKYYIKEAVNKEESKVKRLTT